MNCLKGELSIHLISPNARLFVSRVRALNYRKSSFTYNFNLDLIFTQYNNIKHNFQFTNAKLKPGIHEKQDKISYVYAIPLPDFGRIFGLKGVRTINRINI